MDAMVVLDVAGGMVALGLAVVTAYMAILGGLGMLGAVHFVRCGHCGHLIPASGTGTPERCGHCQHLALYHHPVHAVHEALLGQRHQRPLAAAHHMADRLREPTD